MDSIYNKAPLFITDNLTSSGGTRAKLRFVHLSSNTTPVDAVDNRDSTILFQGYAFKQYSQFINITPGTTTLDVRYAKETTVILNYPGITFTAGKIYTIYLRGFEMGLKHEALDIGIIKNN